MSMKVKTGCVELLLSLALLCDHVQGSCLHTHPYSTLRVGIINLEKKCVSHRWWIGPGS